MEPPHVDILALALGMADPENFTTPQHSSLTDQLRRSLGSDGASNDSDDSTMSHDSSRSSPTLSWFEAISPPQTPAKVNYSGVKVNPPQFKVVSTPCEVQSAFQCTQSDYNPLQDVTSPAAQTSPPSVTSPDVIPPAPMTSPSTVTSPDAIPPQNMMSPPDFTSPDNMMSFLNEKVVSIIDFLHSGSPPQTTDKQLDFSPSSSIEESPSNSPLPSRLGQFSPEPQHCDESVLNPASPVMPTQTPFTSPQGQLNASMTSPHEPITSPIGQGHQPMTSPPEAQPASYEITPSVIRRLDSFFENIPDIMDEYSKPYTPSEQNISPYMTLDDYQHLMPSPHDVPPCLLPNTR